MEKLNLEKFCENPQKNCLNFRKPNKDSNLGRVLPSNCPLENSCVENARCQLDAFYNELCYCPEGLEGDGKQGGNGCGAVDECAIDFHDCKAEYQMLCF